jgi:hypothetical protein
MHQISGAFIGAFVGRQKLISCENFAAGLLRIVSLQVPTKIGLIRIVLISRAVTFLWLVTSRKPKAKNRWHLLKIWHHRYLLLYLRDISVYSVFHQVRYEICRYICSDFWCITKLGCGGWTFILQENLLLNPQVSQQKSK